MQDQISYINKPERDFLFRKIFEEDEYGDLIYEKEGTFVDVGANIGVFADESC